MKDSNINSQDSQRDSPIKSQTDSYILSIHINNNQNFVYAQLLEGLKLPTIDNNLFEKGEILIGYLTIRLCIYNSEGEGLSIAETVSLPTIKDVQLKLNTVFDICVNNLNRKENLEEYRNEDYETVVMRESY